MTSEVGEAFVWVWPPGETMPVVAGKLTASGSHLVFNYGRSYLERSERFSLYDRELPLRPGLLPLLNGLSMPGCLRDASPDAWGRRVILNKLFGAAGTKLDAIEVHELRYLLESGSDRAGAVDFQRSATVYEPRSAGRATLEELMSAVDCVERGIPLDESLGAALFHGTSIGGARPKVLIESDSRKYIAKFSSSSDVYNVVKAEFVAMRLAAQVGLQVAPVTLRKAAHRDVLLIERFDRVHTHAGWTRKAMVSALTLLELDELMARYARYEDLAEVGRHRFYNAADTLKELFGRLVFNILVGNNDDHARNHAAFWDGKMLSLTPAYDICPQSRSGNVATQAMAIASNDNRSLLATCLDAARIFHLDGEQALQIVVAQVGGIIAGWETVCDDAGLEAIDRRGFVGRQFLNPYAFEGLGGEAQDLGQRAEAWRRAM